MYDYYNIILHGYLHNFIAAVLFLIIIEILRLWLFKDDKKMIKQIGLCDNVNEANKIRIRSKKKRKIVIFTVIIVAGTAMSTIVWYRTEGKHVGSWLILFLMLLFLLAVLMTFFSRKLAAMEGNIQPMSIDDFYSCPRIYDLFLRGFRSDELEKDMLKVENTPKHAFSELHYVNDLTKRSGIKVYAVGNPKELDSPHGAQRIYLDKDNWQQEVLRLMQSAREIHIRVCNTPSCLWELQMAKVILKKVTLIVDDLEAYEAIRKSVTGLPILDEDVGWTFYVLYYDDANEWIVSRKKLTSSGYEIVTNATDKGQPYKYRTSGLTIWMYTIIGMGIIAAPDIVMWGELMHEVDEILESRHWTGENWACQINSKCPLVIDTCSVLQRCNVDLCCFHFVVDVVDDRYDDSIFCPKDMCKKVLDVVFVNSNKYTIGFKEAFFDAIYKNFEFIEFDFVQKNRALSSISLSEDDMIELGQLRWHIPSHRNKDEELQIIKENSTLPIHY